MIPSTFSIAFGANSSMVHAECSFYMAKPDELIESLKGVQFLFSKKILTLLESYSTNYAEKDQFLFYLCFFTIDSLKYFAENALLSSFFENCRSQANSQRPTIHFSIGKKFSFSPLFLTLILSKKNQQILSSPLFFQNDRSQGSISCIRESA